MEAVSTSSSGDEGKDGPAGDYDWQPGGAAVLGTGGSVRCVRRVVVVRTGAWASEEDQAEECQRVDRAPPRSSSQAAPGSS